MHRCRFPALLLACMALTCVPAFCPAARAAQWLSWPHTPAVEAATHARVASRAALRLRIIERDPQREVWVDSDIAGPVEVRVTGTDGLSLERVLPGRGAHFVGRVDGASRLHLELQAVPGVPGATASDFAYRLPLDAASLRIGQFPQGRFSHADDENRHAIDFAVPIGTPVLAARDGIVMQVEDAFPDAPGKLSEANFVRILHRDGSMSVYAHLQRASAVVEAGQRVEAGQLIARSGNSGYSSGPHLHFVVQVNAGMRLQSVPVRIIGGNGELKLPK